MNDNLKIIEALEVLAAAMPWDTVELDVTRKPEGELSFAAWLHKNDKFGFPMECGFGNSPAKAANEIMAKAGERDPEKARARKIAELQEQIAKLQAVTIGLPPYKPGRELPRTTTKAGDMTVDVLATSEAV